MNRSAAIRIVADFIEVGETASNPESSRVFIMRIPLDLPSPHADEQAHSEALQQQIRAAIATAGGHIGFDRYMELALYAPGLGYYSSGHQKFGEGGDFVTAPELSPLFSRCLARQCAEVLAAIPDGEILEFGAGSGIMAATILGELAALGCLPRRYAILELSSELRARQQQTIAQHVPELLARVEWLDALPEQGLRGVILANEVLDAMPVQRFCIRHGEPHELVVGWNGQDFELLSAAPDAALFARLERLRQQYHLSDGYHSELNLRGEQWIAALGGLLEQGIVLLIDYGFPQSEYYHPQRSEGTLMCHYRHRAHPDALILPGLQDITAHVDFTAIGEAALKAGMAVRGYTNQASFLLSLGLTEYLAEAGEDVRIQLELANQVKRLTMPGEMGELFKVMALGKGWQAPLRGFVLRDDRARL
ncbi:MAG: class I SAM-dependent methyltransferase [Thiohalomonadaceae bacterium]